MQYNGSSARNDRIHVCLCGSSVVLETMNTALCFVGGGGCVKGTDGVAMYGRSGAFGYRRKKEKELMWTTLKISVWLGYPSV